MKKTFFNNSTKGNETQSQSSKSKRKFLKTFSFTSLALLMGIAGTMAFAPLGATTPLASASTMDQINTKVDGENIKYAPSALGLDPENDPVVYTTDSGLEIKMSNAFATSKGGTVTTTTNTGYTYTQNLSNFYYFTMGTYSGTIYTAKNKTETYSVSNEPVNWIILGLGANTGYFLDTVSANLFSTWKTNISGLPHNNTNGITYGQYFFQNIFENTTPAGTAINGVVPSKSYVMEKVRASIPVNPGNLNEIPEGCMLVLSEKLLGQMYFNSSGAINANHTTGIAKCYNVYGSGYYGSRYRYFGARNTINTSNTQTWTTTNNAGGSLYNAVNNLFSKNNSTGAIIGNSLGFTQAQADLIIPQKLKTYYYNGSTGYVETFETDGNTYYTMFPLSKKDSTYTSTNQNFCIDDYLTTNQTRVSILIGSSTNASYPYWLRCGYKENSQCVYRVNAEGAFSDYYSCDCSYGIRPAMVMKLK